MSLTPSSFLQAGSLFTIFLLVFGLFMIYEYSRGSFNMNLINGLRSLFQSGEFRIFVYSLILIPIALMFFNIVKYNGFSNGLKEGFDSLLGEAHGLLVDVVLFGIILTIYNKINNEINDRKREEVNKQSRIEGYKDEIEFFRGWANEEGVRRTVGNIKLLIKEQVENIDLRNTYLRDGDLVGKDLSGVYFKDAKLEGVKFMRAKLIKVNLEGAQLEGAKLWNANLTDANLTKADMRSADLIGAILRNADLIDAKLIKANLNSADLRGADLMTADLTDANLLAADLRNSYLLCTDLRNANLRDADLRNANLTGVLINGAKVTNPNWIEKLKEWNVIGHQEIKEKYKLADTGEKAFWTGEAIYKIQPKK